MNFYSDSNILNTDSFSYLDEGSRAYIYKHGDVLFKYYKGDCKYRYYISKKMFLRLKELNCTHIVKLYDLYYTSNKRFFGQIFDGYTMAYCGERVSSILNLPTSYLLEMVHELEQKTMVELSKAQIVMSDTHYGNIFFTDNDVTIIDPDSFYTPLFCNTSRVLEENRNKLWEYLLSTFIHELYDGYNYRRLCDYFDLIRHESENTLTLKLKRFFDGTTPMESIKKKNLL